MDKVLHQQPTGTGAAPPSLEQLYLAHFDRLYVYACKLTRSTDQAKDAVSEVFAALAVSDHLLHDIRHAEGYLFVAVKNQCLRLLTQSPTAYFLEHDQAKACERLTPEDVLVEQEVAACIAQVVTGMPSTMKLVYQFAHQQGMTVEEIANELDVSRRAVNKHLAKAIGRIKRELLAYYGPEYASFLSRATG